MRTEELHVATGKPVDNAFIESFNGKFRDEYLNGRPLMRERSDCAIGSSGLPRAVLRIVAMAFVIATTAVPGTATAACGDADGDGTITVADGVQTLRAAAALSSTCLSTSACDVDGSGGITLTDGVNVLRAAAGLAAALTCGATPTPINATPSPVPSVTPTPTHVDVAFTVVPSAQTDPASPGFQVRVQYPLDKGTFAGSGDGSCRTSAGGTLAPKDLHDGVLLFMLYASQRIMFPIEVVCTFDVKAGSVLTANDLSVSIERVAVFDNGTNDGLPVTGNPHILEIGVAVIPQ